MASLFGPHLFSDFSFIICDPKQLSIACVIQKDRDPTNNGVHVKILAGKFPKEHIDLNMWLPTKSTPSPRHTIGNSSLPLTRLHLHLGSAGESTHTRGNSFLEAEIEFYIRTIWESGKNIFWCYVIIISVSFYVYFFSCEFHNSESQLLKYLWETEENGLFFCQPTPSAYYFQSPEGCGR